MRVKSFIAMLLAAVFVFQTVPVVAQSGAAYLGGVVHYEFFDATSGEFEELFELDGSVFYFRRTETYTYSSQLTPYGYYHFAFSYNDSNRVDFGIFMFEAFLEENFDTNMAHGRGRSLQSLSYSVSDLIISDLSAFASDTLIVDMVSFYEELGQINFEELAAIEQFVEIVPFSQGPFASIDALIRQQFSAPYSNRLISTDSVTRGGRTARGRLEESYGVGHVRQINFGFAVGATISVISAVLGFPITTVKTVVAFGFSLAGVAISLTSGTLITHTVSESTMREVFVNNGRWSYEIAWRTVNWNVLQGPLGFARDVTRHAGGTFTEANFDRSDILLTRGMNNYLWQNWGIR